MNDQKTTETISQESAIEIARHVSAILKHPDTPQHLYNDIGQAVCDLSNESRIDIDGAQYIAEVIYGDKINESILTLPELLSAVLKHPDLPEHFRDRIFHYLANECMNAHGDCESPEYIAACLGMIAQNGAEN
jgi:hypothetical protein